jgi:hypothetical protein
MNDGNAHGEKANPDPAARSDQADIEAEARRQRELRNRRASQKHEIAIADLDEERTDVRLTRKELKADRREARALAKLNRKARVSGARAKLTHDLKNTGEIKAIRLQNVRIASLCVFIPVLAAFAAWSTVGVQAGVVKLIGTGDEATENIGTGDEAIGNIAWGVEPALIAVVAGIIIIRAILRTANGDLDWRSYVIEFTALAASIVLNLAGSWPEGGMSTAHVAATIAHSIGPIGAAGTAILISVIDDGVTNAKPYEGAKSVADPTVVVEVSRPVVPLSRPSLSHGTDLGQAQRDTIVGQALPERPTLSQDAVPSEPGTELVPVSRPKVVPVSQSEQFEKVVAAWEAERDAGRSGTVRVVAELAGVSKTTAGRILKPYTDKVK